MDIITLNTSAKNSELELELELIQTRMTQKPMLWVEVGKGALFPHVAGGPSLWVTLRVLWSLCTGKITPNHRALLCLF